MFIRCFFSCSCRRIWIDESHCTLQLLYRFALGYPSSVVKFKLSYIPGTPSAFASLLTSDLNRPIANMQLHNDLNIYGLNSSSPMLLRAICLDWMFATMMLGWIDLLFESVESCILRTPRCAQPLFYFVDCQYTVVYWISCNRQNKANFIWEIQAVFVHIRSKKCVLAFALVFFAIWNRSREFSLFSGSAIWKLLPHSHDDWIYVNV